MSSDRNGNHSPADQTRPPSSGEHLAGEREPAAAEEQWYMPFLPADQPPARPERRAAGGQGGQGGRSGGGRRRVAWYIPLVGGCLTLLALLMAAGAVLVGVVSTLHVEESATEQRPFAVNGTPTVVVEGAVGDLRVVLGSSAGANQVVVRATKHVHGFAPRRDERDLARFPVEMTQSGDTVTIRPQQVHDPDSPTERWVDLTITVPAQTNFTIKLSGGDVHLDGVTGAVTAQLGHGDLTLTDVTLRGNSTLDTDMGDVHISGALASGATVDVSTDFGDADLTLPATTDAHLDASTGAGGVRFTTNWQIPITPSMTGASATGDLAPQPSGRLTVRVGVGDITVAAPAQARTFPLPTPEPPPTPPPAPTPPQPPARPTR